METLEVREHLPLFLTRQMFKDFPPDIIGYISKNHFKITSTRVEVIIQKEKEEEKA